VVPLFGMVFWEHIPMMLMLERFENEQQTYKEPDFFVAYA
jgi:hypothetical protein